MKLHAKLESVTWNYPHGELELRSKKNKSNVISFLFLGKNKVNGKIQSTYDQVHTVVGAGLFFKDLSLKTITAPLFFYLDEGDHPTLRY